MTMKERMMVAMAAAVDVVDEYTPVGIVDRAGNLRAAVQLATTAMLVDSLEGVRWALDKLSDQCEVEDGTREGAIGSAAHEIAEAIKEAGSRGV